MNPVNLQVYRPIGDISRSELDGSNRVAIVGAAGGEMHDVAVDPVTERFYFSGRDLRRVVGSPLEESVPLQVTLTFEGQSEVRDLTLDGTGRLYWADGRDTPTGGIWGIDADGTDREEILPGLNLPHDVAVDTVAGKIYWTDGFESGTGTRVAIRRADLGGLNLETLLTNLNVGVRGIALDAVGGKLYWTDHVADQISRANLDGSSAEVLPLVVTDPHDVSVDSVAGHLYWTEGIGSNTNPTGKIRRSNLDGTGATDILLGLPATIRDLFLVYHRRLPLFSDGFESGDTSKWSQTVP